MFSSQNIIQKLSSQNATTPSTPLKIKLFFDVNGTVMAADASRDKDVDAAILQSIAENYSAQWDEKNKVEMTFRKYVETYLCPGDMKDPEIKKSTLVHYKNFLNFLKNNHHPLHDEIELKYLQIKKNLSDGDVFRSFIELINHLNKSQLQYTLIFRTFGTDLDKIIQEVSNRTHLKFMPSASFREGELVLHNKRILKTPAEMLDHIKPFEHSGWQDHWKHWHAHHENHDTGKPFPINLDDEHEITLFFDDNALEKEILGVKPTSGKSYNQRQLQNELIRLGRIIPVNTLEAMTDNDYFINKLNYALKTSLKVSCHENESKSEVVANNFTELSPMPNHLKLA